VQLVLQADWQDAWHSPQPPLCTLFLISDLLIVLMCFNVTASKKIFVEIISQKFFAEKV